MSSFIRLNDKIIINLSQVVSIEAPPDSMHVTINMVDGAIYNRTFDSVEDRNKWINIGLFK